MKANGITLHYRVDGEESAPAIVFANSLGTDLRIWDRVAAALEGRFRLVRHDKRGHGLSEESEGDYTNALLVADLEALLDGLGVKGALLVGLSVGGQIALGLAAKRPDLAKGLIVCDSAHRVGTPQMWSERMAMIRGQGIAAVADGILERWFPSSFRLARPEETACWRAMLTRTPLGGYLGTCAALRDCDLGDAIKKLTLPALFLVGSEDGATPPHVVRESAALLPGARFREIAGAGHLPCIDRPDEVIRGIEEMTKELAFV